MTHFELIRFLEAMKPTPVTVRCMGLRLEDEQKGMKELYEMQGGVLPLIAFDYVNHRGEARVRKVDPQDWQVFLGLSPHHPGEQWFFEALDTEKGIRTFAVADMTNLRTEDIS